MTEPLINRPGRRQVLAGLALTASPLRANATPVEARFSRVRPSSSAWPTAEAWDALRLAVGGRLEPVTLPSLEATDGAKLLANPFYIRDQPGLTQSSGWLDAWRSAPSAYVVRARTAADVSAAVRFAAERRLRLVVKGGGHSYLGGSNAPDSLLVWTRDMEEITLHDAFTPQGSRSAPVAAVSVGAGCTWGHVYDAVTTRGGRYVQGGGCTTVGVAGLVQGGGFGSFSKTFGLAAASLLEAELVTADGAVRTVNGAQEPDLFWALKGGGGGTFGVVTKMTLRTHDLPATFGILAWSLAAASDDAFHRLLDQFIELYASALFNPHWGEQARATAHNRLEIEMLFQSLDEVAARAAWRPLLDFVAAHPDDYRVTRPLLVAVFPARRMWDERFLREHLSEAITIDSRTDAKTGDWWCAGNTEEAGTFWHGYHSVWMPASQLATNRRSALADAWFAASRHWSATFHFNKGLAGAPSEALEASRDTAMNPQVLEAFALVIIAYDGPSIYPGHPPVDLIDARDDARRMTEAVAAIRQAAPGAGSYFSECDYGLPEWRTACWGGHWSRLSRIKRRYDPDGIFVVHHGVGSEQWSADGFTRMG